MSTLHEDIGDFINNRIQQAYIEIKESSNFKTLRNDIFTRSNQIRSSLTPEQIKAFDDYCELVG